MNKLEAIPIIIKNSLEYERIEKDGKRIFICKSHPELKLLEINKTADFIFRKCDGNNSVNDIINYLQANYINIDKSVLEKDVLRILFNFWRIGVVKFKEVFPFDDLYLKHSKDGYIYKVLKENEVVDFFKDEYTCDPRVMSNMYNSEESLRYRVVSFSEIFFLLENKEGLKIYMGISLDILNPYLSGSLCIYDIDYDLEFDKNELFSCIKWVVDTQVSLVKNINRIDVYLENNNINYKNLIKSLGFAKTGTLDKFIYKDDKYLSIDLYSLTI